jgi:hypothetical protein
MPRTTGISLFGSRLLLPIIAVFPAITNRAAHLVRQNRVYAGGIGDVNV